MGRKSRALENNRLDKTKMWGYAKKLAEVCELQDCALCTMPFEWDGFKKNLDVKNVSIFVFVLGTTIKSYILK